jgi:hypothetical protein
MRPLLMLAAAVLVAVLTIGAPAADARKPLLRNVCKLVTDAEIKELMGHRPISRRKALGACVWTTRARTGSGESGTPAEEASITLLGWKNAREAEKYVSLRAESGVCEWDKLLPQRRLGDEAYVETCASNVLFRLGRIVGDVTTFTNNVEQGSSADTRRTAGFVKRAVPRMRRHRCGPPLCPR